jgi:hypothetical protein
MISQGPCGKIQKNLLIPVVIILITILSAPLAPMRPYLAWAGEGGASTYTPGTNDFAMGIVPPPGLYFRYIFISYQGFSDAVVESAQLQLDARIRLYGNVFVPIVVTPYKVFGANYAFLVRFPLRTPEIRATITVPPFDEEITVTDSRTSLGDIGISPLVLGWHRGNFHCMLVAPTIYFPTGEYSLNNSVNPGRNRYALQAAVNFTYFNKKRGLEAGLHLGYTTNFVNPATDYKSGDEFHLDYILAYHTRFGLALGMVGFFLAQVTGDSGSGATLGPNQGITVGLGPAAQYKFKLWGAPCNVRVKYYNELATQNRWEGDFIWFVFNVRPKAF